MEPEYVDPKQHLNVTFASFAIQRTLTKFPASLQLVAAVGVEVTMNRNKMRSRID
jgi:hypothetical protein